MTKKKKEEATKATEVKILVVDDEEIMRAMLEDVLSEEGYSVVSAASGEEALEKVKGTSFGIVITDIRMPGMDGVEVTRKFKEVNPDICVIAITGYASIESAIAVLKEGAYDYITKPFNIDAMKITVGRAAERQVLMVDAKEKETYKRLSILDGLTEIYNRRYFDEMVEKELARVKRYSRPFSLMMIDIDHFKTFNDTNGHLAGDWALKRIAQILVSSIRAADSVFRYGGEEFAVLLPETEKMGVVPVAMRLRQNVAMAKFLDKKVLPNAHLTISIGIATYPEDVKDTRALIAKADENLYRAKSTGRDKICYYGSDGTPAEVK